MTPLTACRCIALLASVDAVGEPLTTPATQLMRSSHQKIRLQLCPLELPCQYPLHLQASTTHPGKTKPGQSANVLPCMTDPVFSYRQLPVSQCSADAHDCRWREQASQDHEALQRQLLVDDSRVLQDAAG